MAMENRYHHLSFRERVQIMAWGQCGRTVPEIARALRRPASTIRRELHRNTTPGCHYVDGAAQMRTIERRQQASRRPHIADERIRTYVREKLLARWSPELIAGRIRQDLPGTTISHEAIYQYIYHTATPDRETLVKYLRRAHKKRYKRSMRRQAKMLIPNRIPISQRPAVVAERKEFGHWEGDTLVSGTRTAALCSLVERKSRMVSLARLSRRTARAMSGAVVRRLRPLPAQARQTLTLDNGSEHVLHERITRAIGIRCYFCEPYRAWERATNEQRNGLIRWYFPKGTDFARLRKADVLQVESAINNRPMKCLGFKTPLEIAAQFGALHP